MTHEAWNAGKLPEGARVVATAETEQQCCRGPRCNNCPASGETLQQREEVCAAWHALPDDLRKDARLTRLYHALGGPHMEEPDLCSVPFPQIDQPKEN